MKANLFTLTKSEQRVVILIIMGLLAAAFIRYWRDANEQKELNKAHPAGLTATPFTSPVEAEPDLDEESAGSRSDDSSRTALPSPQSSP